MTISKTNSGLYYSSKKLSNGQAIVMLFSAYAVNGSGTFYNVGLAIGKNRKQCLSWYDHKTKYLSGHETGKSTNVKEVLDFCLNILKEFEEYLVSQNKNSCIVIEGADRRRLEVYRKALKKHRPDFIYHKENEYIYKWIKLNK